MFWKRACDGLCGLLTFIGFGWNIKVVSIVNLGLCQTHCRHTALQAGAWLFPPFRKWPDHVSKFKLTHVASLQFPPSGQYGLCFGYCFSRPVPLRSHKGQITFLEPFPGVPSNLDYTQKLAESILALKLSVTTYFHWVTNTIWPRSALDIARMRYYLGPLKFKYK